MRRVQRTKLKRRIFLEYSSINSVDMCVFACIFQWIEYSNERFTQITKAKLRLNSNKIHRLRLRFQQGRESYVEMKSVERMGEEEIRRIHVNLFWRRISRFLTEIWATRRVSSQGNQVINYFLYNLYTYLGSMRHVAKERNRILGTLIRNFFIFSKSMNF